MLRYAAATRAAELRELAGPVDARHRSARPRRRGPLPRTPSRRPHRIDQALERLEDVLTVELRHGLADGASSAPLALGSGTRAALAALRAAVRPRRRGSADRFHAAVRRGSPRRGPGRRSSTARRRLSAIERRAALDPASPRPASSADGATRELDGDAPAAPLRPVLDSGPRAAGRLARPAQPAQRAPPRPAPDPGLHPCLTATT